MNRNTIPGIVLAVVAGLTACALGPHQYREVAPVAPDVAYTCAQLVLDSLGYTVKSSDRVGGFLKAERSYLLGSHFDILTLAMIKQTDSQSELHVTAETEAVGADGGRGPFLLSGQVKAEANLLLTRCGGSAA